LNEHPLSFSASHEVHCVGCATLRTDTYTFAPRKLQAKVFANRSTPRMHTSRRTFMQWTGLSFPVFLVNPLGVFRSLIAPRGEVRPVKHPPPNPFDDPLGVLRFGGRSGMIEAPCSKLQGIFEVQGSEEARFPCCSLTPQQAAGNALAMHFQALTWRTI
jgi:hypothetical protein